MTETPCGKPDSPLIEVEDLAIHFDVSAPFLKRLVDRSGKVFVKAVDGLSFKIKEGDTFALVGESGCGKSTVGNLLVGLYSPTRGRVLFRGRDMGGKKGRQKNEALQSQMQMIFQNPYASLNPRWDVRKIVAEPIVTLQKDQKRGQIEERVGQLLAQVGLSAEDATKYPHEFSGGQRQRISIARALAGNPKFIVCDEPTSALDVSVQAQILNLMRDLQRRLGLTYFFISHDLAVVYHISTTVGVMYLGRMVEWGQTKSLFAAPLHPYTRMLLEAIPRLDMTGASRTPVAGEVPSPLAPPSGCTFHPRCPEATKICSTTRPPVTATKTGFVACHAR